MLKISYKEKKKNLPKEAEASKVVSVGTSSTQVEEEGGGQKDKTHVADDEQEASLKQNTEEEDECDDSEEEVYNSQSERDTPRVKKPIWMAQEGYGRCGKGCEGCAAKCDQQNLENCQNCHLNLIKNTSSYGCHNRKACLEPKAKLVKGGAEKVVQIKKLAVKSQSLGSMAEIWTSSMVQMEILQFSGKGE